MNTIITDTTTTDVEPDEATSPVPEPAPDTDSDGTGTTPDQAASTQDRPVLLFVDPSTVLVEKNVRKTPKVSREFVASVKRHGVLNAMRGYFNGDGQPVIHDGQRRILAAQKAGRTEAPAVVYPNREALMDAVEAERARIIEQLTANAHAEAVTAADEAEAVQQLALTGLEATVIAKELSVKPERVNAALAVAANDVARKAVDKGQVTLDQAAIIAEFADDKEAVKTLTDTAGGNPQDFDHEAQRIRDRKERERAAQAFAADLAARGIPVVEAPDEYDKRSKDAYLSELQDEDGKPLDAAEWEGKDGYAIALYTRYGSWRPTAVITDWRTRGLRLKTRGGAVTGKMTEAEKEARREVVANNKEWDSAETVRREWLTTLLSRKTLPKDADQFVAYMATERASDFGRSLTSGTAATLLGVEPTYGALAKHVAANPSKARQVLFALAVAAGEIALDRGSWRRPSDRDKVFLNWLTSWGYTTSRVEDIIANPAKPKASRSRRANKAEPTADALTEATAEDQVTADVESTAEAVGQDAAEVDTPTLEVEADEVPDADVA
jgi:ParB family chromosome partitioning protein